jgi:hypothetical protein
MLLDDKMELDNKVIVPKPLILCGLARLCVYEFLRIFLEREFNPGQQKT